jgi:hypothetical protein
MSQPVLMGATLSCSFGIAPSSLLVLPANRVNAEKKPMANIMDNKPYVNVMPFGVCSSLANPITAAQTTAALGVLTPGTCTPMIPAPWTPGAPTVMVAKMPALTNTSKCMCAYGGVIQVNVPGATTETLP